MSQRCRFSPTECPSIFSHTQLKDYFVQVLPTPATAGTFSISAARSLSARHACIWEALSSSLGDERRHKNATVSQSSVACLKSTTGCCLMVSWQTGQKEYVFVFGQTLCPLCLLHWTAGWRLVGIKADHFLMLANSPTTQPSTSRYCHDIDRWTRHLFYGGHGHTATLQSVPRNDLQRTSLQSLLGDLHPDEGDV